MAQVTLDGGQSSQQLGGQTLEYITQHVLLQCPGAPDTLVQAQLQLVAREFYTKSTSWRTTLGPFAITIGRDIVQLNPVDQNSRLQFVLGAYLQLAATEGPTPLNPLTRQPTNTGTANPPNAYYMQQPDVMQLYPPPSATRGPVLYIYACLVPTQSATSLPDISFTQHLDGLLWGTLSRMMYMPKKNWSNKELAQMYDRKYRSEILMARDIANRGYGPANTSATFPNFAGRSGSQVLPRAVG